MHWRDACMEHQMTKKEFKEMLVEWFYSGSWVKEESEETYA